jgi:VanZ family protein
MNRSPWHRIVAWLPALLWASLIFFLSAQPVLPKTGPSIPHADKLAHLVMYAILGFLTTRALRRAHNLPLQTAIPLAILIGALYGASDEWHQSFIPPRTPDMADWIADVTGTTLAQLVHWYDSRRSKKTHR